MTLDEMDKLAAEKVMGWRSMGSHYASGPMTRDRVHRKDTWQPTSNIAQAFELLEKINYAYQIFSYNDDLIEVLIYAPQGLIAGESKKVVAEAITKACLKAVGVDV